MCQGRERTVVTGSVGRGSLVSRVPCDKGHIQTSLSGLKGADATLRVRLPEGAELSWKGRVPEQTARAHWTPATAASTWPPVGTKASEQCNRDSPPGQGDPLLCVFLEIQWAHRRESVVGQLAGGMQESAEDSGGRQPARNHLMSGRCRSKRQRQAS